MRYADEEVADSEAAPVPAAVPTTRATLITVAAVAPEAEGEAEVAAGAVVDTPHSSLVKVAEVVEATMATMTVQQQERDATTAKSLVISSRCVGKRKPKTAVTDARMRFMKKK